MHSAYRMQPTLDIDNSLNLCRRHTGDITHISLGSAFHDSKKNWGPHRRLYPLTLLK